jgi:outer membrane protein OmpA-like peptidoglycan-associated protein
VAPPPPPPPAQPPPPTTDVLAFDAGRYRLTNIAKAQLDQVALRLRDNRGSSAVVTGFPDETPGSRGAELARQRAEAAKAYLIDRHQIDASRIRTETDMTTTDNRGTSVVVVNFSR